MTVSGRMAEDGVLVLEALGRVLRDMSGRSGLDERLGSFAADQIDDIAAATARDARVDSRQLEASRGRAGSSWDDVLLAALNPEALRARAELT